jgi:hypothetical protein
MPKRIRKPPVRPEVVKSWLRRHEVDGESAPRIASADGYDVRTVRKHLELARQDREVREAKHAVLTQAIERHYADLCSFAEKLKAQFQEDVPSAISPMFTSDPMWRALREHMPKSPLWKDLERWAKLEEPFRLSLNQLRERIKKEAQKKASLRFVSSPDEVGLSSGFIDALSFHLRSLAGAGQGLGLFEYAETKTNFGVQVQLGAYLIATVSQDRVKDVEKLFRSLTQGAIRWEEYASLHQHVEEVIRLQRNIREELTRIILRRIVPGRCIYCPF